MKEEEGFSEDEVAESEKKPPKPLNFMKDLDAFPKVPDS